MESPGVKVKWLAVCCAFLGGAEGLRTVAYFDPVGIPTGCFGETAGVRLGMTWTVAQCEAQLGDKLTRVYGPAVDRCAGALPPYRKASYVSLAYNIGTGAFCTSTVVKRERAGNVAGACDAILLYNKMRLAGVLVYSPGLAGRREREQQLCMKDLPTSQPVALLDSLLDGRFRAGVQGPSWPDRKPSTASASAILLPPAPSKYATLRTVIQPWRAI